MTVALTSEVLRRNYGSSIPQMPIKAAKGKVFYKGAIVCVAIASGLAYPGGDAAIISTSLCYGICSYTLDTSADAADGDHDVIVEPGTFGDFATGSSSNEITEASIGLPCYVQDDTTVYLAAGSLATAGKVYGIADDGASVIVQFEVIR